MAAKEEKCEHMESEPVAYFCTDDERPFMVFYCADCDLYFYVAGSYVMDDK